MSYNIATKYGSKVVHIQGLAEKTVTTGNSLTYSKSACPALSRTVFAQYHHSSDLAATIKKADSYAKAYGQSICKRCLKRAVELLAELAFEIEEAHAEALEMNDGRVADLEEAHTEAILEASDREQGQELEGDHAEALAENERRIVQARRWAAQDALYSDAADDEELEALGSGEAAHFETTNSLPAYKTQRQIRAIRRAFERRAACPWVVNGVAPCQRWAGHPGGCVVEPMPVQGARVFQERGVPYRDAGFSGVLAAYRRQAVLDAAHMVALADVATDGRSEVALREEAHNHLVATGSVSLALETMHQGPNLEAGTGSVPPGGFPDPLAVAALVRLVQGNGRAALVDNPGLGVLADMGLAVKIPGLTIFSITPEGREYARRWVLASPVSS